MYAPIYHPPAPAPDEVRAAEGAILAAEGPHHVNGRYIADEACAARERRWAAERRARDAARRRIPTVSREPVERVRAVTWTRTTDRARLDAIVRDRLGGAVTLAHRESLESVRHELASDAADALVVGITRLDPAEVWTLAILLREFPAVAALGVVVHAEHDDGGGAAGPLVSVAIRAGRAGLGAIADLRRPDGLARLRTALDPREVLDSFARRAVAAILSDLAAAGASDVERLSGASIAPSLVRFVVALFSREVTSAERLAERLGTQPSTLASRCARAGVPTPKRWVSAARLVRVARLAETPGRDVAALAHAVGVSSPQSLRRSVRRLTGLPPATFRACYDGAAMLERFRATLVAPYRDALRSFVPVDGDRQRPVARRTPSHALGGAA